MKLKIRSGYLKNSNLAVPKIAEPVKGIVKQSLFNYLAEFVEEKVIIDLYAGSGNIGFEAISRGAKYAVLVETDYEAVKCLNENVKKLNLEDKVEVEVKDALKFIEHSPEKFDIIFSDPPYNSPTNHLLNTVNKIIDDKGIFVYFHKSTKDVLEVKNMKLVRTKKFGKSSYSVYKML